MELKDVDRETLIKLYWERSVKALDEADMMISTEHWNLAANRIYYAVFYAVSSLFVKDGYPIKTHRGAKIVMSNQYVMTGKIGRESLTLFSQLESLRDRADYNVAFEASKEDILDYRPKADIFIAEIKNLIDSK